ncbi:MAG: AmmeMemoRadiSam system protein B [Chlorobi bacterium]|nr:AmmeMemoRadiSam system protein B [Chlorobiota bacterium]
MINSITEPVPPLRQDIEAFVIEVEQEEMVALRDPLGIARDMLVFHPSAYEIMRLFNGDVTVQDVLKLIAESTGDHIQPEHLLKMIRELDAHKFLLSPGFIQAFREEVERFQNQRVRTAFLAGDAYPEQMEECRKFIAEFFAGAGETRASFAATGIVAPHIDLRVGGKVYVPAFNSIKHGEFDTVIVLGTSHYSDEDFFILCEKDFETPLGTVQADRRLIQRIREKAYPDLTRSEFAHRNEHSIEFPVLFLKYLFGLESPPIVPVLCTSLQDAIDEERSPGEFPEFQSFTRAVRESLDELGRKPVFIISVDWSHIGKKFGDMTPAADMLDRVRKSDLNQLEAVARCDAEAFHALVVKNRNRTRIDGYSCLQAYFEIAHPRRGEILQYEQWHEIERESAVTFASLAFR